MSAHNLVVPNNSSWRKHWVPDISGHNWGFGIHSVVESNRKLMAKHAHISRVVAHQRCEKVSSVIFIKSLIISNLEKFDLLNLTQILIFQKRRKYGSVRFHYFCRVGVVLRLKSLILQKPIFRLHSSTSAIAS